MVREKKKYRTVKNRIVPNKSTEGMEIVSDMVEAPLGDGGQSSPAVNLCSQCVKLT